MLFLLCLLLRLNKQIVIIATMNRAIILTRDKVIDA